MRSEIRFSCITMEEDTHIWKKMKPSPRFMGPYEILERIGPVAYRLALPFELAKLHDVFHVSMLQRYRSDELHILPVQDVQVQQDFSYDEEPKAIINKYCW